MPVSTYKYSPYTQLFTRYLRIQLTGDNDDKEEEKFKFDLLDIPKETELIMYTRRLLKIQRIWVEIAKIEDSYKINKNDKETLSAYLRLERDANILVKVENMIDDLLDEHDRMLNFCKASNRKDSMIYGFMLYYTELIVKKVCDTMFGIGEPSNRTLLKILRFDLKDRRINVIGRPEYVEGGDAIGNASDFDRNSSNYREGGDGLL